MTQATPPDSRVVPAAYLDNEGRLVALEGVPSGGFVAKGRAIPDSWTPLIPASALTAREEQVRAKLEDCHRECCNDFPKGSVYMHGAMDAFMAIGVLTEEQRRLWNLAMKTCPGHDSPRAWCAYCGNVKEESHD